MQTYRIEGMDCADCARTIEKGVSGLSGVKSAQVDFMTSLLNVEGDVTAETLNKRVEALGYKLAARETTDAKTGGIYASRTDNPAAGGLIGRIVNSVSEFVRFLLRETPTRLAVIGGAILLVGVIASLIGLNERYANLLYIAAVILALLPLARSGFNTLVINREFNINLLMTIAAVGAILIGEMLEAAVVVFLFAIGEALEGYTADRARQSIRGLMTLQPTRAILLFGGMEIETPIESIKVNDLVLVKAGENIPVDGIVADGTSAVDQSLVTGESIPVAKQEGSDVYAGTINGTGALTIRVTKLVADNTVNRIIQLVEEASSVRAPSQRMVDEFARVYTPAVVAIAALVAVVPPLMFSAPFYDTPDGHGWLYRALSLLVIACPCALVISTPVTVISAITAAARRGVLIKGGAHLEALGRVTVIAFDKTGTLTRGKPIVTNVRAIDCPTDSPCEICDDVLALANAVERRSAHPLARAVGDAARDHGVADRYIAAEAVETLTGLGVQGVVNGTRVTIGSHDLFDREYPHDETFCDKVKAAEAQGQTTMLLNDGERVRGYIAVADDPRPESANVLAQLHALGLRSVMLTGDVPQAAARIAEQVGVYDVRAGLMPADKVTAVRELLRDHGRVAMIGDGINDTPALAAATVGIAMGGAGSAQALEIADVALMADDLRQLHVAVRLSRFARQLIKQNMIISFGVKGVFIVLALFGATSLWLAILADVGTSLVVTLNGMRAKSAKI
jgi:Cd2+/Zn2+-exporting ATPase